MTNNVAVSAELQGTIVGLFVEIGTPVRVGDVVALVESMKMHHEVVAPVAGVIDSIAVIEGATIAIGQELVRIAEGVATEAHRDLPGTAGSGPLGLERDDVREVIERHAVGLDEQRPDAVERRRSRGHRTTRENIGDLVDDGRDAERDETAEGIGRGGRRLPLAAPEAQTVRAEARNAHPRRMRRPGPAPAR